MAQDCNNQSAQENVLSVRGEISLSLRGEVEELYRRAKECVKIAIEDGLVKDGVVELRVTSIVPAQQVTIKFEFQ